MKPAPAPPLLPSCRLALSVALFLGITAHYSMRMCLNFGVVCMVIPHANRNVSSPSSHGAWRLGHGNDTKAWRGQRESVVGEDRWRHVMNNESESVRALNPNGSVDSEQTVCTMQEDSSQDFGYKGEFAWSRPMVGLVVSAFAYGYFPMQLLSGWLATKLGGKHVLAVGMGVGTLGAFLTPTAARASPFMLVALRVVMGVGLGVTFPTFNSMMGRWAPPQERSLLTSIPFAGISAGMLLAGPITGYLCQYSWTIPHYLFGGLSVLWLVLWYCVAHNGPEEHPRISERERSYILQATRQLEHQQKLVVPWCRLLSSPAVWALCAVHFSLMWTAATAALALPLYSQDVLRFNIKQNGLISAAPNLLSVIMNPCVGAASDLLTSRGPCSLAVSRKAIQTLSSVLSALLVLGAALLTCEWRLLAVPLVCLLQAAMTVSKGGYTPNSQDIAARYCGVVYGLSNSVGQLTGFLVPLAMGYLTTQGTREEWQSMFYINAAVLLVGNLVFLVFGRTELQPWAETRKEDPLMTAQDTHAETIANKPV